MQRIKVSGVDLSIRCHLPILAFSYAKILVSTSPATSVSRDTPVQTGNGPIRKAVVDADDLASGGSGIAWDHHRSYSNRLGANREFGNGCNGISFARVVGRIGTVPDGLTVRSDRMKIEPIAIPVRPCRASKGPRLERTVTHECSHRLL
jgi:hypothetical protein